VEELHAGRPDEVLVERAQTCEARFLVVGSLGTRDENRWPLGSIAERTAQSAGVPTLVVRADHPFERWLAQQRTLHVVVAFDFTVTAEAAVDWVRMLRAAGPCDVTVAYTNSLPQTEERLGVMHRPGARGQNPPVVQSALERDVRERIELLLGSHDVHLRVQPIRGAVADSIMEIAADAHADLIVTGTRQVQGVTRLWQGSVSRGLLSQASHSVACVPIAAAAGRIPPVPSLGRVLVTTDFSSASSRAIAYALAVARPGGRVRLVHVVHPRALARGQFEKGPLTTPRHAAHLRVVGRRLQDLLPPEADALGIATDARVVESEDVAKGIRQEAERFGADVIVIASRGLSGVERMVLGSVAQAVMTRSTRPVFVTRLPEE
jgi:nucleotide-binding universal stress UspA family protein